MSEILDSIKTGLENIEALTERRKALETEQRALPFKIRDLTAAVGGGDIKSVSALTVAKSRLELIPDELSAIQREFDAIVRELRTALHGLGPVVARAYGAKYESIQAEVAEFLAQYLDGDQVHLRNELTRSITTESRQVRPMDSLRTVFHGSVVIDGMSAQAVISRCKSAVQHLSNVI